MDKTRPYSPFRSILHIPAPYLASKPHGHSTWELALYRSGEGWATIGRERVPIAPGTIICYPPDVPHVEHASVGCTGWFVHAAAAPWPSAPVAQGRDRDGLVAGILARMHEQSLLHDDDWQARMQAWHDLFIAHLRLALRGHQAAHPAVERLKAALAERFREPGFSAGRAMRGLGLSQDHLRRRFESATGTTPQRYLIDLRIAYAKNLLAFGASVVETAAAVGFADPYYFSRAFLAATGARPSAWRG